MTDDHLSLDELAELDEGLLPPERISVIRAHLHGCEECRARASAITSTRAMLADLPPVTMPDDVKARLDAALAAEAASSSSTSTTGNEPTKSAEPTTEPSRPRLVAGSPASETVTPPPGSVSRPRFGQPSMAAIAVAAAFVLAGGAVVVGHLRHHDKPASGVVASTAPDFGGVIASPNLDQGANFTITSTGEDYTTTTLPHNVVGLVSVTPTVSTLPAPAAGGGATAGATGSSGGVGSGSTATGGGTTSAKSGNRPGRGAHHGKKHPVASGETVNGAASAPPTLTPVAPQTLDEAEHQPVPHALRALYGSRRKILACAATVSGTSNAVPLTVDFGRWTNADLHRVPAAIFVFKSPNPAVDAVYVTRPACDGTLLTFANVAVS